MKIQEHDKFWCPWLHRNIYFHSVLVKNSEEILYVFTDDLNAHFNLTGSDVCRLIRRS